MRDRDYMRESLNLKPKTGLSTLSKTILIGTIALILIAKGIEFTKELKIPATNPTDSESIKINNIIQSAAKIIQQQTTAKPKSRVCKIKKNGDEECKFVE